MSHQADVGVVSEMSLTLEKLLLQKSAGDNTVKKETNSKLGANQRAHKQGATEDDRKIIKTPTDSASTTKDMDKTPADSASTTKDMDNTSIDSSNTTKDMDTSEISSANSSQLSVPTVGKERRSSGGSADPYCNPAFPRVIHFEDVTSASFKIRNGIVNTPCSRSQLSAMSGMELYLKKDFLQYTGSFKERGARYALLMLSEEQKKHGVISASLGNHAQGLSYHGQLLNIPVTVVMPVIAPIMKVQSCCNLGANVIVEGSHMGEAKSIALHIAREKNQVYINGYDHPHIMAGQGTIGLEILEQVPGVDAIVVPVGGGGLIAGIATAVKGLRPGVQIIGVESERCASFTAAREAGKPVACPVLSTLADGLAVPTVGYNAFATANNLIDKLVVVREEWIAIAILRLVEQEKCIAEGAGACGLAAILAGQLDELKGKKVVVLLCGGNIDTTTLGRCLERGLAADGRLLKFTVCVSDRPGGIAELCRLMAEIGVSIKDMMHDRAWLTNDVFSVDVMVICETRDLDHSMELMNLLHKTYSRVRFEHIPTPDKQFTVESSML